MTEESNARTEAEIKARLRRDEVELDTVAEIGTGTGKGQGQGEDDRSGEASEYLITGHTWCSISVPGDSELQGILVRVPLRARLGRAPEFALLPNESLAPSLADIDETCRFVTTLANRGQIASGQTERGQIKRGQTPSKAGTSHQIELTESGQRRLVRRGFQTG